VGPGRAFGEGASDAEIDRHPTTPHPAKPSATQSLGRTIDEDDFSISPAAPTAQRPASGTSPVLLFGLMGVVGFGIVAAVAAIGILVFGVGGDDTISEDPVEVTADATQPEQPTPVDTSAEAVDAAQPTDAKGDASKAPEDTTPASADSKTDKDAGETVAKTGGDKKPARVKARRPRDKKKTPEVGVAPKTGAKDEDIIGKVLDDPEPKTEPVAEKKEPAVTTSKPSRPIDTIKKDIERDIKKTKKDIKKSGFGDLFKKNSEDVKKDLESRFD